ncbi:glycosyl transferase, group 1 family protein [Synechococcus sp. PCC 7335]|uniref:glycosyltransferase family 4 protein n=1 Tax=Synechococcus sp. (strain ATCC 29403 / PCC 7335) TaxID=91464 RepID=UPI00017ED281|nr:glycosyltransferase family 1 protein [Synechococcus sp. PCC 7335]EDX86052.1 glycosyl transferase, group 1 family protein [Synechococcus sp. PCC 7335]
MKIGFDISQTGGKKTGCGYYADALVRQLLAQYTQDAFLLYPAFGDTYWDPTHVASAERISLHNTDYPFLIDSKDASFNYWRSPKGVDEQVIGTPDVVHSNNFSSPHLRYARLVCTVYDLSFVDVPECTTEENRYLCFNGTFLASVMADMVIAISHYTKKRFLENFPHVPAERVVVSHLGNRLPVSGPEEAPSTMLEDRPFLLAVGTLEPRKNLRRLLLAYKEYLATSENPKDLALVGPQGWLESDLDQYISKLGLTHQVHILGYASDAALRWLYKHCWAFVYPSLYEGFGLPVLEAMAAGAATITSNTTSLPEVGGDAVVYIEPLDKTSITSALLLMDNDYYRRSLQVQCVQQAKKFDWATTASVVHEAYEEAMRLPRRRTSTSLVNTSSVR